MSEPVRKPKRTPESYNPKMPEIANMMQNSADKHAVREHLPHSHDQEWRWIIPCKQVEKK